jgi:hypothetical protein
MTVVSTVKQMSSVTAAVSWRLRFQPPVDGFSSVGRKSAVSLGKGDLGSKLLTGLTQISASLSYTPVPKIVLHESQMGNNNVTYVYKRVPTPSSLQNKNIIR